MQIGLPRKRGKNKKRFVTPVYVPVKVDVPEKVEIEIQHPSKSGTNAN
jgi:hypothetical protein